MQCLLYSQCGCQFVHQFKYWHTPPYFEYFSNSCVHLCNGYSHYVPFSSQSNNIISSKIEVYTIGEQTNHQIILSVIFVLPIYMYYKNSNLVLYHYYKHIFMLDKNFFHDHPILRVHILFLSADQSGLSFNAFSKNVTILGPIVAHFSS
jgi:hypothetical protein